MAAGALSQQLYERIRHSISAGQVVPGDRLPATRQLARELGVARGTVTAAIERLVAEGLLDARTGAGTFVSEDAGRLPVQGLSGNAMSYGFRWQPPIPDVDSRAAATVDFRPCRPSLEAFPLNVWRRCLSAAIGGTPDSDYGDPRGLPILREAIADYLRRARGLTTSPEHIIVTNGAVHAMQLVASLCLGDGTTAVFENPGYPLARQMFAATGAHMSYCGIDADGLRLNDLPDKRRRIGLVYVTPSHQFPVGSRLSLGRRKALIEWAGDRGAVIVEDDYDGEFRFDVQPLAPMAVMAPQGVIYCGTFSKTLFPGLRIGFAVAPEPVIQAMAALRSISEYAPNELIQKALTKFIVEGEYEKHIHRMRRIYAGKRKRVAQLLDGRARLTGLDSGLSALIELPDEVDAAQVSAHLKSDGVLMPALHRYEANGRASRNALVCGYAEPSADKIELGIHCVLSRLQRT